MKIDQKIIDIDDTPREDDRPQEHPVFSIERNDSDSNEHRAPLQPVPSTEQRNKRHLYILSFLLIVLACGLCLLLWNISDRLRPDIESAVSDKENLLILRSTPSLTAVGTVHTSDSVLGVAFDMYALRGLRGSLEQQLPDTADKDIVMFMRSADYHPDGSLLGTVVIDGKKITSKDRTNRLGYIAISNEGVPTIGISSSNRVADFTEDNEGSFFRQYALLGDGELPSSFSLHGKVERGAIARKDDNDLYYVVTRHRETMYDFADALREYGFTDAVYITGGNSYDFYRTTDGIPHISSRVKEKIEKYTTTPLPAPLLVFRRGDKE